MKWLETPGEPAEAALRRALDQARARTGDEIAQRRVWTRIAALGPEEAPRARPWIVRLSLGLTVTAAAAGALLVWPRAPAPEPVALDEPAPLPAEVPQAETAGPPEPAADERTRIEGPATVRTRARERARLSLRGGAELDLEPNSVLSIDPEQRPVIQRGRLTLSVPPQPPGRRFALTAGPYVITVLGTKFHVRVVGDSVGVDVEEGVVEVWREGRAVRLESGESWTSPFLAAGRRAPVRREAAPVARRMALAQPPRGTAPEPGPVLAPSGSAIPAQPMMAPPPPPVAPSAPVAAAAPAVPSPRAAQAALAEGRPDRAYEIYDALARGTGPAAENAAYELGRVLRDHLLKPREAIAAWNRYRSRFPRGALRAEVDLSIVETLHVLGDRERALGEAEGFLARHPDSERRAEVTRLVERLRAGRGAGR